MKVYKIVVKVKSCYHSSIQRDLKENPNISYGSVRTSYVKNLETTSKRCYYHWKPIDKDEEETYTSLKNLNKQFYYICDMGYLFVFDEMLSGTDYGIATNLFPELKLSANQYWLKLLTNSKKIMEINLLDEVTGEKIRLMDEKSLKETIVGLIEKHIA